MNGQGGQCPYCQLINNPEQLLLVDETENFYAWLEIQPRARGHTQVVPKEHLENLFELSFEEYEEMQRLVRRVVQRAKDGLGADGVSVTMNVEEAGGQMLPHMYVSVFPRFQKDETAGTPTGAIFPQREELQQDLEEVQGSMESLEVDLGESKVEPHEESERFKEEDSGGLGSILETDTGSDEEEEDTEQEPEQSTEDRASLSRDELWERLVSSYGSEKDLLESESMREMLSDAGFQLRKDRNQESSSLDWR